MNRIRGLWLLFVCQAILSGGLSLSYPFFAIYLHRGRGVPMAWVGAFLSLGFLTTAVSQGFGGELSDLFGRRRVMIGALWARAATVAVLAWAMWKGWSYPALVGLHIVSSFGGNFFDPAARSWLADYTSEEERVRAYGFLRIAINLGWGIGPALGGLMAQTSYAFMFLMTSVACVVAALLVTFVIPDAPGVLRGEKFRLAAVLKAGEDRRFLRFCWFSLLISVVMAQLVVSLSIHATDFIHLSEMEVGLLFSLNGLMVAALQYPLVAWWGRYRLTSGLVAGSLLYAAGYLWIGFARAFPAMAAAVAVITFGEMAVSPGIAALAANMAPVSERGRYQGFSGLLIQSGMGLGPLTGGLGLQYISPHWLPGHWVGVSALALASAAGFLSLRSILSVCEEGFLAGAFSEPQALGMESLQAGLEGK